MSKVVDVVVDDPWSVDNLKKAIGGRFKKMRHDLGLTQKALCAVMDKPLPSVRDYEGGKSIPGGDAIASLVRAGINANWLLTGEGSMLLSDLLALAPAAPQEPRINVDALEAIIEGTIKALPKASPDAIAREAVGFYVQCIEKELITSEGIGSGNLNAAA